MGRCLGSTAEATTGVQPAQGRGWGPMAGVGGDITPQQNLYCEARSVYFPVAAVPELRHGSALLRARIRGNSAPCPLEYIQPGRMPWAFPIPRSGKGEGSDKGPEPAAHYQ